MQLSVNWHFLAALRSPLEPLHAGDKLITPSLLPLCP